jgi:hypothetical protein
MNGGGGIKQNSGGVNSSMIWLIHCKSLCKCQNVLPHSTTIMEKILETNKQQIKKQRWRHPGPPKTQRQ